MQKPTKRDTIAPKTVASQVKTPYPEQHFVFIRDYEAWVRDPPTAPPPLLALLFLLYLYLPWLKVK